MTKPKPKKTAKPAAKPVAKKSVASKKPTAAKKVAPAKKAVPTKKIVPAKKATPAKKAAPAKKVAPVKKVAGAKKPIPVKKVVAKPAAPAKKVAPVKPAAPAKKAVPVKPTAPAKKATPVKKPAPVKKANPVVTPVSQPSAPELAPKATKPVAKAASKVVPPPVKQPPKVAMPAPMPPVRPVPKKTLANKHNPTRYGVEDLAHFRTILEEKRASLLQDIQDVKDAGLLRPGSDSAGSSAAVSNHLADSATDYSMQETGLDLVERTTKYLTLIEDALDRVNDGTYGICKDCRTEAQNLCPTCPLIPKERLEVVPTATRCVHTKTEAKKRESVEMRQELARMFAEQQRK